MFVIRWIRNGVTERRFVRGTIEQVLPLLVAGQMLGHSVRVEIETERGFGPMSVQ